MIQSPKNIFKNYHIDEDALEMIDLRYIKGLTLREIGEKFGLTRERIRQLINENIIIFNNYLLRNFFKQNVYIIYEKRIFYFDELIECIGDYPLLISLLKLNNKINVNFYKPLNLFFFENYTSFIKEMDEYQENLAEIIDPKQDLDGFYEILKKYNITLKGYTLIEQLLTSFGYIKYGEIYSKTHLNKMDITELLLKKYVDSIILNDESYENIKRISIEKLNYKLPNNIHSFENRIRSVKNILLTGPKTFTHISKILNSKNAIPLIEKELIRQNENYKFIGINIFYDNLIKRYPECNYLNKYTIYSLIKIFFNDKISFSTGNTMDIYFDRNLKFN